MFDSCRVWQNSFVVIDHEILFPSPDSRREVFWRKTVHKF